MLRRAPHTPVKWSNLIYLLKQGALSQDSWALFLTLTDWLHDLAKVPSPLCASVSPSAGCEG